MSNANALVFYAGQPIQEFDGDLELALWRGYCAAEDPEIYNGAYIWYRETIVSDDHWYRMDLTPVLLEDVPPALRAWALIL